MMIGSDPLTNFHWRQINRLLREVDRAAAVLEGNRKMEMDVPEVGVLGGTRIRAGQEESKPVIEAYFQVQMGRAWDLTLLQPGRKLVQYNSSAVSQLRREVETSMDRFPFGPTKSLRASPYSFGIEANFVDEVPKSKVPRRLKGTDSTRHRDEIQQIRKTQQLTDQWLSWLRQYLQALIDGNSLLSTVGTAGEDGALYVNGTGRAIKCIRPDGTILSLGEALHEPEIKEEEAIRDKIVREETDSQQ